MKFPFVSFFLAILIFIFFLTIFFGFFVTKSAKIQDSFDVDASIVDELSKQMNNKNNLQDLRQNLASKKDDNSAKNAQEKLENNNIAKAANPSGSKENKIATVTQRPLPEIPEELRQEAFNSYAIARFYIAANGEVKVELIKPCNNPKLNQLLLQSLRKWRFSAATQFGVNVDSTQDIKVKFSVE